MWGAITEFCKVFAEKHLIPSVISVVGAITVLLFMPADYWMITKLGKMLFFFLVSGVFFLAVQFVLFCFRTYRQHRERVADNQYQIHSASQNEKIGMEELWSAVDSFDPDDRELIRGFLESNNTPIQRPSGTRYFGKSLLASNWVISTEEYIDDPQPTIISERLKSKGITAEIIGTPKTLVKKYKLCNEIFMALKYSKEKYGKISHFE